MGTEYDCSASFRRWARDEGEPLALRRREAGDAAGAFHYEFTSRGDRVAARLEGAAAGRPLAVVLTADAEGVPALGGVAVATLALPLHGNRHHPKWSARLAGLLRDGAEGALDRGLVEEFLRQAVCDVQTLLHVCGQEADVDLSKTLLLGHGPGALAAAAVRAATPGVLATALAPGELASDLDPAAALEAPGSPCTVLGEGRGPAWAGRLDQAVLPLAPDGPLAGLLQAALSEAAVPAGDSGGSCG